MAVRRTPRVARIRGQLFVEPPAPLLDELDPVDLLVALRALRDVGAGGCALDVDHVRTRLEHHPQAVLPRLEAEVGVLVVHRREPGVKAADVAPEVGADHQRCRRAIVDLAAELVQELARGLAASVVAARPVAPDHASRLAERIIGIEVLRGHDRDVVGRIRAGEHRDQPAELRLDVVVAEHQPPSPRLRRAAADALLIARVGLVGEDPGAAHVVEQSLGLSVGRVVDEDHLVADLGRVVPNRLEAAASECGARIDRDHERHLRLGVDRQDNRARRFGLGHGRTCRHPQPTAYDARP